MRISVEMIRPNAPAFVANSYRLGAGLHTGLGQAKIRFWKISAKSSRWSGDRSRLLRQTDGNHPASDGRIPPD